MRPEEAAGIPIVRTKFRQVLGNKNFLLLWLAQGISLTAQNMINFTLLTSVFELSGGRSLATSILLAILTVPAIFLSAYGGMVADKNDRRAILIVTNLLRAGAALLFLLFAREVGLLGLIIFYINAFIFSSVNQFFIPAETASIPNFVKKEELLKANALFTQTLYVTFILGISLAGPIQGLFGKNAPYPAAALMFAVSGLMCWALPKMKKSTEEVHVSHILSEVFTEAWHSFKFIKQRFELYMPVLEITVAQVAVGIMVVLAPGFVDKILKVPTSQAGLLVTPAGIGMIAGAIGVGLLENKRRLTLPKIGFVLLGLFTIMLANIREIGAFLKIEELQLHIAAGGGIILLLIVLAFLIGLQLAIIYVPSQTSLQEESDENSRGRVFGFLNMAINLSATIPLMIAGVAADIFEVKQTILTFGILLVVFGMINLYLTKRR